MARLILLVASGTLLLCQTLATFSTSGEDDDGSSSGSIEQEEIKFVRHVDPTALHSWPAGPEQQGSWNQHSSPYPAHDPYHQQTLLAQPQPQPRAYPVYQPAPAVQPQYEPYTGYQPLPGAQPQAEPYPVYHPSPAFRSQAETYPFYQPAPAIQPHAETYPFYQPAPAIQPHAETYPFYQPAPAIQPHAEPYPVYQPSPAVQPQAESYPFYQPAPVVQHQPINQPSPAVQPQAESYPFYQPAPVEQHQLVYQPAPVEQHQLVYQPAPVVQHQPIYQPSPAVQPQAESYPFYQPAPVVQHQPVYQPAPVVQHQPVYQPAPVVQHQPVYQPAPVYQLPSYRPYHQNTAPVPGQPTVMVRYIPGAVSRRYTCRQKQDCGWNYVTQPGRYIYVSIPPQRTIIQTCPRQQCNPMQTTCYPPPPIVNPPPPIVYPPPPTVYPPVQPYSTCAGHNQCGASRQCCYAPTSANMGCYPGAAVALRSERHLQFNSTVTNRSRVELVIGDWRDSNVTSFVTDHLLPLKVDLEHDMEVILLTDPKQNGGPCDAQDADCIGPRILSCVAEMWPSLIQLLADAGSAPDNTPFLTGPSSSSMAEQPEAGLEEPLANTTTDLSNHSDDVSRSFDEPSVSGGEHLELFLVDPVASAAHARQVRLLSFAACLLQSFGSGLVERKKTALLAAKRCVRANKLDWPRVRACVAPRGHGVAMGGRGQDPSHTRPTEIIVNGEPAPHQDNLKLALCQALLKAGQAPLLCDLLYDELDQRQEEQSIANTEEGSTDTISYEDQDSPSMRPTDYHGLGRGWSDQGLGFSQGLPRDQTQDGADRGQKFFRIQEAYGAEDAHGAMDAYGPQEAYGTQEAYRTQETYGMEDQRGPEESEDQNAGFSMSRVSRSLDEVPASSTIWTGGVGNPYEV